MRYLRDKFDLLEEFNDLPLSAEKRAVLTIVALFEFCVLNGLYLGFVILVELPWSFAKWLWQNR